MKRLWQRLQIDAPGLGSHEIEAVLNRSVEEAIIQLKRDNRLLCERPILVPKLPSLYEEVLRLMLETHREPDILRIHFLESMPALWVEQMASRRFADEDFFHRVLEWDRLPRLSRALSSFVDLMETHGVSPVGVWSWASIDELKTRVRTLSDWMPMLCFGSCFPLLYAYPGDISSYAEEVRDTGDFWDVFDRRMTHPLVHELSHLGRKRSALFPPLLDESISAYLGFIACPSIAFPQPGSDNALMGAPFFIQIGQFFVRNFGLQATLRAHAGDSTFEALLGVEGFADIERLGWNQLISSEEVSLLAGHDNPMLWHKIVALLGAKESLNGRSLQDIQALPFSSIPVGKPDAMDLEILADGLRAMCLHSHLQGASYRVEQRLAKVAIELDFVECLIRRSRESTDRSHADPVYLCPPAISARLRERGVLKIELRMTSWEAIEVVASALFNTDVPRHSKLYELRIVGPEG